VVGLVDGTRFTIRPLIQLPVEEIKAIWSSALAARLK